MVSLNQVVGLNSTYILIDTILLKNHEIIINLRDKNN